MAFVLDCLAKRFSNPGKKQKERTKDRVSASRTTTYRRLVEKCSNATLRYDCCLDVIQNTGILGGFKVIALQLGVV